MRTELAERFGSDWVDVLKATPKLRSAKLTTPVIGLKDMRFDVANPRAVKWAREHAAQLAVDMLDDAKQRIARVVADGIARGRTIRETAKLLRKTVGLTEKQGEQLLKLRDRLEEDGWDDRDVEDEVNARAEQMTRDRADTIAHHETMVASNKGQEELWQQAVDEGLLTGREMREWIVTPDDRLCSLCLAMEGKLAPLDGPWVSDEGDEYMTPQDIHVNCRCTEGISAEPTAAAEWDEADHPRDEAGKFSDKGGDGAGSGDGSGGAAPDGGELLVSDYRGIKQVSFAPQGTTDVELIAANRRVIDDVLSRVPPEAVRGLEALYVTGGDPGLLGTALYVPVSDKRGYVSDEIMLTDGWLGKDDADKALALAEEIGHRYQLTVRPDLWERFTREVRPTVEHLKAVEPNHWQNYLKERSPREKERRISGEVFASSFALHVLGRSNISPEVDAFWQRELPRAHRAAGGPGSGNFGHAGRPGEVGGSVSISESIKADTWYHGSTSIDLESFSNDKISGSDLDAPYTGVWLSTSNFTSPAMVNPRVLYTVEPIKVDKTITRAEATKFARELQKDPDYERKFKESGAKGSGDYVRMELLKAGYDVVIHSDKPKIDVAELERTGQTTFLLDGVKTVMKKEPLFRDDPHGVQSYDIYQHGGHITGYESPKQLIDQHDRQIVILDANNVRIVAKKLDPWGMVK